MPGKQAVNLKPVKKPAQRKEEATSFAERTSLRSERSSLKSNPSSNAKQVETKVAAKTPPTKKKITQAQLDRAKRERERMAQQVFDRKHFVPTFVCLLREKQFRLYAPCTRNFQFSPSWKIEKQNGKRQWYHLNIEFSWCFEKYRYLQFSYEYSRVVRFLMVYFSKMSPDYEIINISLFSICLLKWKWSNQIRMRCNGFFLWKWKLPYVLI